MYHRTKTQQWLTTLSFITACFAFLVIGVGAFTRLSDAGLGCPDWPACYGHFVIRQQTLHAHIGSSAAHDRVIARKATYKAQIEMTHRYIAGILGLLIIVVALLCGLSANDLGSSFLIYSLALFTLLIYQVILGMWTVTLKLSPIIVMQHLLVGMTLLLLLWLIYLRSRKKTIEKQSITVSKKLKLFALFSFSLLFLQVILGGWTSSHYVGLIYSGLSAVHRWCSLIVGCTFLFLFFWIRAHYRSHQLLMKITTYLLLFLGLQIVLGVINVLFQLPLLTAIAHNLVAALMLLMLVTINYYLRV